MTTLGTGIARTEFTLRDLSVRLNQENLARYCTMIEARRGEAGKAFLIGSEDDLERIFGIELKDLAKKDQRGLRHSLNRGAVHYVARAVHYSDVAADTVDGTAANHTFADRGSSFADAALNTDVVDVTAVNPGTAGNDIDVVLVDPSGNDQALSVAVNTAAGVVITVSLATNESGTITTTAAQLVAALNGDALASQFILAALATGEDGSTVIAAEAAVSLTGGGNGTNTLKLAAKGVGVWANAAEGNLQVRITNGPLDTANGFTLEARLAEQPGLVERWPNLSMDPASDRYAVTFVNERSVLVSLTNLNAGSNYALTRPQVTGGATGWVNLDTDGADGGAITTNDLLGDASAGNGIHVFDGITDASRLYFPDNTAHDLLVGCAAYVDQRDDLIYYHNTPSALSAQAARDWKEGQGSYTSNTPVKSRNVVYYEGDHEIRDPRNGGRVWVNTVNFAIGVSHFSERVGNPWSGKAGLRRGKVPAILSSRVNYGSPGNRAGADILQDAQVNFLATFPEGPVIWGQDTSHPQPSTLRNMTTVDLLFILKRSSALAARWELFQPHLPETWRSFARRMKPFLQNLQTRGAFTEYLIQADQDARNVSEAVLNNAATRDQEIFKARVFIRPTPLVKWVGIEGVFAAQATPSFTEFLDVDLSNV